MGQADYIVSAISYASRHPHTCTEVLPTSFSSMSESKFLSLSNLSCICEDMSTYKVWKSQI